MPNESPTKVQQMEREIDALRLLFKRRPIISMVIVLWLIGPVFYAVYEFVQRRSIQKENATLKQELSETKRDRDAKGAQLAPFLATAELRFPDAPPDKRLELLLNRLEDAIIQVEDAARRMGSKMILSEDIRVSMINRLKHQPSLKVDITAALGNSQPYELAEQLKTVFLEAGWPISKGSVSQAIFSRPQLGCKFVFSEKPSPALQEIFLDALDSLGEKKVLYLNPQQEQGTLKVIIGSR